MTPKPRRASREEIGIATRWLEVLATDPVGPGEYVKALLAHIAYLEAREARLVEDGETVAHIIENRENLTSQTLNNAARVMRSSMAFDPAAEEEKRDESSTRDSSADGRSS